MHAHRREDVLFEKGVTRNRKYYTIIDELATPIPQ